MTSSHPPIGAVAHLEGPSGLFNATEKGVLLPVVGEVIASRDPSLRPGQLAVGWATGLNGLQEYLVCSAGDLHAFDDDLPASVAIMIQPLACVIYAMDHLSNIEGSTAAVIGQGPIGVLFSAPSGATAVSLRLVRGLPVSISAMTHSLAQTLAKRNQNQTPERTCKPRRTPC